MKFNSPIPVKPQVLARTYQICFLTNLYSSIEEHMESEKHFNSK